MIRTICYFALFFIAYFAIGAVVNRMGWELPGTIHVGGGYQLVQIIAANTVAAAVMGRFRG